MTSRPFFVAHLFCAANGHESPSVRRSVPKGAIEGFTLAVLPRVSGLDEIGVDRPLLDPFLDAHGEELRAIFTLDDRRIAAALDQVFENTHPIV